MIPSKKKRVVVLVDEDNKAWLERQALRYGGSENSQIMRSILERPPGHAARCVEGRRARMGRRCGMSAAPKLKPIANQDIVETECRDPDESPRARVMLDEKAVPRT